MRDLHMTCAVASVCSWILWQRSRCTRRTCINHPLGLNPINYAGTLVIKEAVIGSAPTQRRFKPRAKGSAGPILRRSSHISITLVGSAPEKKKKKVARKTAAASTTEEAPAAAEEQA